MSLFDYQASREITALDMPFYALIMSAMRQADTANAAALRAAFPDTWDELQARHDAPGGILPTERCPECGHAWTDHDDDSVDLLEIAGCHAVDNLGECLCTETRP